MTLQRGRVDAHSMRMHKLQDECYPKVALNIEMHGPVTCDVSYMMYAWVWWSNFRKSKGSGLHLPKECYIVYCTKFMSIWFLHYLHVSLRTLQWPFPSPCLCGPCGAPYMHCLNAFVVGQIMAHQNSCQNKNCRTRLRKAREQIPLPKSLWFYGYNHLAFCASFEMCYNHVKGICRQKSIFCSSSPLY